MQIWSRPRRHSQMVKIAAWHLRPDGPRLGALSFNGWDTHVDEGAVGGRLADLYEARDPKPTTDLRAVLKGVLRDHPRVEERALATSIFPGSEAVAPMGGLLA